MFFLWKMSNIWWWWDTSETKCQRPRKINNKPSWTLILSYKWITKLTSLPLLLWTIKLLHVQSRAQFIFKMRGFTLLCLVGYILIAADAQCWKVLSRKYQLLILSKSCLISFAGILKTNYVSNCYQMFKCHNLRTAFNIIGFPVFVCNTLEMSYICYKVK